MNRKPIIRATLILLLAVAAIPLAPRAEAAASGERLLYFNNSAIKTIRSDGTGERTVVRADDNSLGWQHLTGANWGPDATRLTYTTTRCISLLCEPKVGELHTVRADGTGDTVVVALPETTLGTPRWSPSGDRIAFITSHWAPCWGCPAVSNLWVVNSDGSGLVSLGPGGDPVWSPGGQRLAFGYAGGVMVMDFTHSAPPRRVSPVGRFSGSPKWSPDGRYLAFVAGAGVWVVRGDGTGARQLDATGYSSSGLSWSPDSKRLVIASGDGRVVITHRWPGPARELPIKAGRTYAVAWHPSGASIAYLYDGPAGPSIRSISPDGSSAKTLTATGGWTSPDIAWSP